MGLITLPFSMLRTHTYVGAAPSVENNVSRF